MQQAYPFRAQIKTHRADAGDVTAWTVETFDESGFHRVGAKRKNNRNFVCCQLGCACRRLRIEHDNDRNTALRQLGRKARQSDGIIPRPAKFAGEVLTFDEIGLAEAFSDGAEESGAFVRGALRQEADNRDRLRPRRKCPSYRSTAE